MSIWSDKKTGRLHVGIMANLKRIHRVMPKGATKSDAKQVEAELLRALSVNRSIIQGDPLISQVMTLYIDHASSLRSPKTARQHAERIGPWTELHRASEARQCAAHFVKDCSGHYQVGTVNRSLGTMKKALKLAWEAGYLAENYSTHVTRLPEHNARSVYLSLEQVRHLASHASANVAAAIWIGLLTGCRRGEIIKIRREDIGRDSILIHAGNTKTLRTRTVPIVPALRPWLKFVPLSINFEGLKTGFDRARKKAGLDHVNFHDLRHSCASILIASGADLFTVSKILGHTTVKTTERYTHLEIGQQAKAMRKAFASGK